MQKSDICCENALWMETKNIKWYHKDYVTSVRHHCGNKCSLNQSGWPIVTRNKKSPISIITKPETCTDMDAHRNKSQRKIRIQCNELNIFWYGWFFFNTLFQALRLNRFQFHTHTHALHTHALHTFVWLKPGDKGVTWHWLIWRKLTWHQQAENLFWV